MLLSSDNKMKNQKSNKTNCNISWRKFDIHELAAPTQTV